MASSRARVVARASSRFAMLAQAISSTSAVTAMRILSGCENSERMLDSPVAMGVRVTWALSSF